MGARRVFDLEDKRKTRLLTAFSHKDIFVCFLIRVIACSNLRSGLYILVQLLQLLHASVVDAVPVQMEIHLFAWHCSHPGENNRPRCARCRVNLLNTMYECNFCQRTYCGACVERHSPCFQPNRKDLPPAIRGETTVGTGFPCWCHCTSVFEEPTG